MKNTVLIFLFLVAYSGKQYAQPLSVKKDQRLIVVTHVENEKYADKLVKKGDPEKSNLYTHLVNDYNTYIKEAVPKYLDYFSDVDYKTEKEIDAMSKEEKSKCYFLLHTTSENIAMGLKGLGWLPEKLENVELDPANRNDFSKIELTTYNRREKIFEPIITKNIYYLNFSKADIYYSVEQLNRDLSGIQPSVKKGEALRSKTLVLNKELLDVTEAEIKTLYPNNFKIVDNDTFEKYRLSGDKTVVCLVIVPLMKVVIPMGIVLKTSITYSHLIYDPSNGDNHIGLLSSRAPGYTASNDKITSKSFEFYLKD